MYPIILADSVTLTVGQIKGFAESSLRSPFEHPTYIDEIRFLLVDNAGSNAAAVTTGGWIWARIRAGNHSLTNGFIPVFLLDRSWIKETTGGSAGRLYTWRLPAPVFMKQGEILEVELFYNAQPQSLPQPFDPNDFATVTATVSLAGRALETGDIFPSSNTVPWVTAFLPTPAVSGAATIANVSSSESDLCNPFDTPLKLHRVNGRFFMVAASGTNGQAIDICEYAGGGVTNFPIDICNRFTNVQIRDSDGLIVVRDKTPFGVLFQITTRSWKVSGIMPPHGFWLVNLEEDWTTASGGAGECTFQPQIAIVGTREVPL